MPVDIPWLFDDTIPTTYDMRNELRGTEVMQRRMTR